MRSVLVKTMLTFALTLFVSAQAAGTRTDPSDVVRATTDELLSQVKAKRDVLEQDEAKLYGLVEEVVLPVVDFDYVARLVLGKYWRRADAKQRQQFTEQFRKLLVRSYAAHLLESDDVTIEYGKTQRKDDERAVATTTVDVGRPEPVSVRYVMHMRNGQWQVYDVIIEGVSTVITFRNQFSQEIRRQGLDGFLEQLASKNELAVNEAFDPDKR